MNPIVVGTLQSYYQMVRCNFRMKTEIKISKACRAKILIMSQFYLKFVRRTGATGIANAETLIHAGDE